MKMHLEKPKNLESVVAAKLRKRFNREFGFSIGERVRTYDGNVGEFYGISTFNDPSQIKVFLYGVKNVEDVKYEIREIPVTFYHDGKNVSVYCIIQNKPDE